jgi:hypothetical protein
MRDLFVVIPFIGEFYFEVRKRWNSRQWIARWKYKNQAWLCVGPVCGAIAINTLK